MNKTDNNFIKIAEKIAKNSQNTIMRYKLAALVVDKKSILSIGYNRFLGIEPTNSILGPIYSFHAEHEALRKCLKIYPEFEIESPKLTLYVARRNFRLAKPCDSCYRILSKSPVSRVVYSVEYGKNEEIIL